MWHGLVRERENETKEREREMGEKGSWGGSSAQLYIIESNGGGKGGMLNMYM